MSILVCASSSRRRRQWSLPDATETYPYTAQVLCTTPTPDGSGATIHPSVIDMGPSMFDGYRWWMANTPYPFQAEHEENPCIYRSNDRVLWSVPEGLTNPIDPWPGPGEYNSDNELVWDPENERFVCFYRHYIAATGVSLIVARSSSDGVTWSPEQVLIEKSDQALSPSVVREPSGQWVMWIASLFALRRFTANDPMGPWTERAPCTLTGGISTQVNHGGVCLYGPDLYLFVDRSRGAGWSIDGINWTMNDSFYPDGGAFGELYRPSIQPSTKAGWVDMWFSVYGDDLPGRCGTLYTRVPLSAFGL